MSEDTTKLKKTTQSHSGLEGSVTSQIQENPASLSPPTTSSQVKSSLFIQIKQINVNTKLRTMIQQT